MENCLGQINCSKRLPPRISRVPIRAPLVNAVNPCCDVRHQVWLIGTILTNFRNVEVHSLSVLNLYEFKMNPFLTANAARTQQEKKATIPSPLPSNRMSWFLFLIQHLEHGLVFKFTSVNYYSTLSLSAFLSHQTIRVRI